MKRAVTWGRASRAKRWAWAGSCIGASVIMFVACGGSESEGAKAPTKSGVAVSAYDAGGDDRSRCDFEGRRDREVVETRGPGAMIPNVRRVYAILGQGEDRRRILICREVDTNLDGMKDLVRTYDEKGQALREQMDSDYDGRVDRWMTFAAGRMAKLELDKNSDGQPDEFRYYSSGKLARVQQDTNFDGKPDAWEIYSQGTLERRGVDIDHDGIVDRWDRDEVARQIAERKEQEELEREEEERKKREAAAVADGGVTDARVSARNR